MTNAQDTDVWVDAMLLDDLWEGEMAGVRIDTTSVLLVNVDGDVHAYENRCPHQAWALDVGEFDGDRIICTRHLWEFDSRSGAGINPADCRLKSFRCRVDSDGVIRVVLP